MQVTGNHQTYKIVSRIKQGKFNYVYIAESILEREKFIIKFISKNNPLERIKQLQNEFYIQAVHPNIATVVDCFETNAGFFVVRRYIEGNDLAVINQKKDFTLAESVKIAIQVLIALDYLHQRQIVHGDIRPENILLTNNNKAILLDLGLSRNFPQSKNKRFPFALLYAAPEQILQKHHLVNPSTDMFALGLTMWHIITGEPQITNENPEFIMHLQLTQNLVKPGYMPDEFFKILYKATLRPELRKPPAMYSEYELDNLLAVAVNKRYKTALEMKEDLLAVLPELEKIKPTIFDKINRLFGR
ncbi:MAG: serine/threonine-protein kinase [Bacteroidia bacterium]